MIYRNLIQLNFLEMFAGKEDIFQISGLHFIKLIYLEPLNSGEKTRRHITSRFAAF